MKKEDTALREDIKNLRVKTENSFVSQKLKKTLIGGFEKNNVISFVNELKEREANAKETFTARIGELMNELSALKTDKSNAEMKLAEAESAREETERKLQCLYSEYKTLEQNSACDTEKLTELGMKCADYEEKIIKIEKIAEKIEEANRIKAEHEKLQECYEEIVKSRNEYIRLNIGLTQDNCELKAENEKLKREAEKSTTENLKILAAVRSIRLSADGHFGEFEEKHRYLINSVLSLTENALVNIREIVKQSEEYGGILNQDFESLKLN